MCPVIRVTDELFDRLESHAVGFDTPSRVIERLLDQHEGVSSDDAAIPVKSRSASGGRLFTNTEIQQRIVSAAKDLSVDELEALCDEALSKEVFGINFPLFVRVADASNETTKKKAVKTKDDVSRWSWKHEFSRDGYAYAVCTQWYPKSDVLVAEWLKLNGGAKR
jgi:hypothetical protein